MTVKKKPVGPVTSLDGIVFTKNSPITSQSEPMDFVTDKGDTFHGYAQRYDVDVNHPHGPVKKGDIVYSDMNHMPIANVVSVVTK